MGQPIRTIRLGTRGSPLALRQTEIVRAELARVHPEIITEVVIIKTSGDWTPEQGEKPLDARGGGKALFAKEIEEQLLAGTIHAGVHSMKDMDSGLPEGLSINCILPREDVRDAVILRPGMEGVKSLRDLPRGTVIGTCSLRRQGFLLSARPDLKIDTIRGNVGTRLDKLRDGKMAGILLARAGLNRLNMAKNVSFTLSPEEMIPSAGQGAIGIETLTKNEKLIAVFNQINCAETLLRVKSERAVLAKLGGSCHTPVGVYAVLEKGDIWIRSCLVSPDGKRKYEMEGKAGVADAERLATEIGKKLKEMAPKDLL